MMEPRIDCVGGEIWFADRGDDTRRLVFVISDARFHRLAERVVVAPVLDEVPASPRPWHALVGDRAVAVNWLGTTPNCETARTGQTGPDSRRCVKSPADSRPSEPPRAVDEITK